jgi:uncharacterized protein
MPNSRTWLFLGLGTFAIAAIASIYEQLIAQNWLWIGLLCLGGAIAISKGSDNSAPNLTPLPLSRTELTKALTKIKQIITKISDRHSSQATLLNEAEQIAQSLSQNQFRIAVFGSTYVGKTSVINAILANPHGEKPTLRDGRAAEYAYEDQSLLKRQISLLDTAGIQERGTQGSDRELQSKQIAQSSDLLIFVIAGDLMATEYQELLWLTSLGKRVILAFNKTDQYLPLDQEMILTQLSSRTADFLSPLNIVAIAANPAPLKVRQYEPATTEPQLIKEWLEPVAPNISPLKDRIEQILSHEWEELLLKTTNWKIQRLHQVANSALQNIRHQQAHEIIVRYQWLNAGVVFANPLPAIDLVATVAINSQLLIELSSLYEQPLRLQEAKQIATAIAEILLKIGCVEVATVAIAAQVSYIFKTNALTYAIGGTIQGVSAAYLTHLGGISFLDYLDQVDMASDRENLIEICQKFCQTNFSQMQNRKFLTDFVNGAMNKLAASL